MSGQSTASNVKMLFINYAGDLKIEPTSQFSPFSQLRLVSPKKRLTSDADPTQRSCVCGWLTKWTCEYIHICVREGSERGVPALNMLLKVAPYRGE